MELSESCVEQLASENPANRRTAAETLPLLCQQCMKPVKCTKWSIAHMMQGGCGRNICHRFGGIKFYLQLKGCIFNVCNNVAAL